MTSSFRGMRMAYDFEFLRDCRRMLEQPAMPERSYVSAAGEALGMALISTPEDIDSLAAELEAQDPDSQWGYREWLQEAAFYPGFVVACRNIENGRAIGFLCFDTLVFIHDLDGSGRRAAISVKIEPKTVYVSESERGRGAGAAFIDVVAMQVPAILGRLEAMSRDQLRDLQVTSISASLEAECVSVEGSRFMRRAFRASERELQAASGARTWPVSRELADHIDHGGYDEELDCSGSMTR